MGRKRIKFKITKLRKEFKKELYDICKNNNAITMLIIETYVAKQHRKHISEIWWLMNEHPDFHKEYKEKLFGRYLTGDDKFFKSIYFANEKFYLKYNNKIPEDYAMGDALAVAYRRIKCG